MHLKPTIVIVLYLFVAGCYTNKIPYQVYLDGNADTVYQLDHVHGNMAGYIESLGYHTNGPEYLSESFNEDVKQAGLILEAKSILTRTNKIRAVFGNGTDSCILLFTKSMNNTRNGRSALISILNLVSTVKGEAVNKQDKPDTSLTSIVSEGTIMLNDRISGFYFKRNYNYHKKTFYEGWLVLHGDTIMAKQVKDLRDEKGKMKKANWAYDYWLELNKNGTCFAALGLTHSSNMKLYILKSLSESEKMLIAAYLSIIVFNS